ncbi:hypothetical protein RRF57_004172 [Xylaria bambusicola]|uniref:Protein kinase domain-containing protein n=1 Tax=Xylaria bambusicola TaxID=326684 RepID=A0AAN7Z3L0_9PEZI
MMIIQRRTITIPTAATTRRGESGTIYSFLRPLGRHSGSRQKNVWLIKKDGKVDTEFIAKGPSSGDDKLLGWPAFQHELKMQRLFNEKRMIRPMVDFLPSSESGGPMMVLKPYEQTLWDARNTRPMTTSEVKWIMEGVLCIMTVHQKGLVYTGLFPILPLIHNHIYDSSPRLDLKMENVGITGFDNKKPNENIREIIVRLADCGSVSEPGKREISALTYRSQEVYFGKHWDYSTDVWSWGIILAQLLLAQVDFKSPGMYDALCSGTLETKAQAARTAMVADFDLCSVPLYAEEADSSALLPRVRPGPEDIYMWAVNMDEKGVPFVDIQFLVNVLNPRPNVRPTAQEILHGGYLKGY